MAPNEINTGEDTIMVWFFVGRYSRYKWPKRIGWNTLKWLVELNDTEQTNGSLLRINWISVENGEIK